MVGESGRVPAGGIHRVLKMQPDQESTTGGRLDEGSTSSMGRISGKYVRTRRENPARAAELRGKHGTKEKRAGGGQGRCS